MGARSSRPKKLPSAAVAAPKEALPIRVVLFGDSEVGKSSILKRYCRNLFDENEKYHHTMKPQLAVKMFMIEKLPNPLSLEIWDTNDDCLHVPVPRVLMENCCVVFLVVDITKPETWQGLYKWKQVLDNNVFYFPKGLPVIVLANKCDQAYDELKVSAAMDEIVERNQWLGWTKVSARNGAHVEDAMRLAVKEYFRYQSLRYTTQGIDETQWAPMPSLPSHAAALQRDVTVL
eukprot:GILJ01002977.1.p1 GENE.GILJ01002977.1~~GILJ01002977.1.p1  ORF type:complete len:232 (-),score=32.57 GILJ01002977.1:321-1016(-)